METTLAQVFSQFKSETMGAYLNGKVCSLAISADKKTMLCHVEFDQVLTYSQLTLLEQQIAKCYHLTRLRISPRYQMDGLSGDYIQTLAEELVDHHPSARGLLDGSSWEYEDGRLQISMTDAAAEYLAAPMREMSEKILTETGQSCPVVAVPVAEEDLQRASKEMRERRQAKLKKAAEQITVTEHKPKPKPAASEHTYHRPAQKAADVKDENVIFGKLYQDQIVPIKDAVHEIDRVTIEGDVFFSESREIKSKKTGKEWIKLSFDITDQTYSVRVCKFMDKIKADSLLGTVKTGMHVIVQGKVTYDQWEKETIIEPSAIIKGKRLIRQDKSEKKRVELHLHTNMSAMDGLTPTKKLIERAVYWGHTAMAITDHGVAQAYPDAMHAVEGGKLENFKVIYGIEAYYVNDAENISVVKGDVTQSLEGTFICFDLETTGLRPDSEEITEIAASVIRDGQIIDEFQTYVNPHKHIPEEITKLTGITDQMVADAPDLSQAIPMFIEFVAGRPLVAHNAGFDMSFLHAACKRLHITTEFTSIDTLEMSRILFPDLSKHKLNVLAKHLHVGPFEHHRASEDAAVLARIFIKLLQKLKVELKVQDIAEINAALAGKKLKNASLKSLPRYHFIILVKNQIGLKNLYKLISFSYLQYFNKRPIMPKSELIRHREGLIFGSACEAGEIFRALTSNTDWKTVKRLADFYDYLEIQPIGNNQFMIEKGLAQNEEDLREYNRKILQLADELHKPCCATGDVHFLDASDEAFRRILMAGQGFQDADHQPPLYLKTTDEMLEEFSYLGKDRAFEVVVTNTNLIADMCQPVRPVPKENYPPKIEGSAQDLENMCREKAKRIYGSPLPELVQKRLDRELGSIIGNGYDVMYIIAQKLVTKSIEDGYLVGSRGSVGSSFAAFMSDITEVNSLAPHYLCPKCKFVEWHPELSCGVDLPDHICPECGEKLSKEGFSIPFETFLGFDGDKVPDIDLNFSGEYQAKIHHYTGEIFGHDHVFRAGTLGTVAEKTAYGYVKKYMEERGLQCSHAEENRLTAGCTGIKRTTGQHPGGIVVVPKEVEIYDFCPIQHPADDPNSDIVTTHFEYHSIDANLLKLDELGHDDPTMIKHLEELTGLNAQQIPLDDPETMSLFTTCDALHYVSGTDSILGQTGSIAVPEFGTKFVRGMLRDTQPKTFDELVRISGLSHGTDVWLGNAQTLVAQGIPLSQCICCRDDIMNYLMNMGVDPKLSFTIMELVRKGKGLKPEMEEAMRAQNVPEWYIDSCNKIKYMFPKAHAVAYVMMAFRIAWFKVHQPLAFYSAYFSIRAKGFDANYMILGDDVCVAKIHELAEKERDKTITAAEKETSTTLEVCHEFYKRGFTFERMDIYRSDAVNFLVTEQGLLPPFTCMPGVGGQAAQDIVRERVNGPFLSAEDITIRCPKATKGVVEALEQIGALGSMPKTTQVSLF